MTRAHCLTPSTFWTSLGVPTCPSHGPGTAPSWLGTFASENPPHAQQPEGATLWLDGMAGVLGAVWDLFYARLDHYFVINGARAGGALSF